MKSESISLYAKSRLTSRSSLLRVWCVRTCVVGNEEADVGVVENGGDTDEAGTPSGNDGDVLPGVLARFALAVHLVVQMGNSVPQGLDARGRAIFTARRGDVDVGGPGKAAWNVVVGLGGALYRTVSLACRRPLEEGNVRPRLAHFSGSSRKPYSEALSVHQTTPVDALVASRPAWGR